MENIIVEEENVNLNENNPVAEIIHRSTAIKTNINEILTGKYIKEEGWKPNYILSIYNRKIYRVNIIGVVVNKIDNSVIELEDYSGKIEIRTFDNNPDLSKLDIGNVVMIIGKPREFNQKKYILCEIFNNKLNIKWLELRKLELNKFYNNKKINLDQQKIEFKEKEVIPKINNEIFDNANNYEKILKIIKEKDLGDGVDIEIIEENLNEENVDEIIKSLIAEGEIYEIKPGKLKIL